MNRKEEDMFGVPEEGMVEGAEASRAEDMSGALSEEEELDKAERGRRQQQEEEYAKQREQQAGNVRRNQIPSGYIADPKTLRYIEKSSNFFRRHIVDGVDLGRGVYLQNGHFKWHSVDGNLRPEQAEIIIQHAVKAGWATMYAFGKDGRSGNNQAEQVLQAKLVEIQKRNWDATKSVLAYQGLSVKSGDAADKSLREPGYRRDTPKMIFNNAVDGFNKKWGDRLARTFNPRARYVAAEQHRRAVERMAAQNFEQS